MFPSLEIKREGALCKYRREAQEAWQCMGSDSIYLPRVLCLHGGDTSAMIFSMQTQVIQHALRQRFRFVFVDSLSRTIPGPGVMPFFEGCGPSWRLVKTEGRNDTEVRQVL